MLEKKYYDGTQIHRIISEEVKDYDTIMKILKRFADEPSALGTDLAEVGTDMISRQWVKDVVKTADINHPLADSEIIPRLRQIQKQIGGSYAIDRAIEIIQSQPMRKKGRWIDTGSMEEWWAKEFKCSECGESMLGTANYCHNCGAEMEKRE